MEADSNRFVLWEPGSTASSTPASVAYPQLAEFVVVTNSGPVRERAQLSAILDSPPTLDMIETVLRACPLTGDHFRMDMPVAGTFAVWVQSAEGNGSLIIPRGFGGPQGGFSLLGVPNDCGGGQCLNLVTGLASSVLGMAISAESVLQSGLVTTRGEFTVFAFGVTTSCDVCGRPVESGEGYTLSARQVVSVPWYWRLRYERNRDTWSATGIYSFDEYRSTDATRDSEVRTILSAGGDWLVCDDCIAHFPADLEAARQFAAAWWKDKAIEVPDSWAADPSDVDMG